MRRSILSVGEKVFRDRIRHKDRICPIRRAKKTIERREVAFVVFASWIIIKIDISTSYRADLLATTQETLAVSLFLP